MNAARGCVISVPLTSGIAPQHNGAFFFRHRLGLLVSRTPLPAALDDRDAREAADTRTPAEKWLGDPPGANSVLCYRTDSDARSLRLLDHVGGAFAALERQHQVRPVLLQHFLIAP